MIMIRKILYLSIVTTTFLFGANYSAKEVFAQVCSKCHNGDASGNTHLKAPSLNDLDSQELEMAISDVREEMGMKHIVMKHNMDKIKEMGMNFSTKEMAEYIYKNFYKG